MRSFSFRAGLVVFVVLCATMTTLRIIIFSNSVDTAYSDIRLIVDAHIQELDEAMELDGLPYITQLVKSLVEEPRDKHLYVAIRTSRSFIGNFSKWPVVKPDKSGWSIAKIQNKQGDQDVSIYFRTVHYKKSGAELLVGYDMQRVALIRETLTNVLLNNTILSFVLSFIIVLVMLWLLNRHLQRFNAVCDQVMEGNLAYRITPHGSADQFDRLGNNLNRMLDWINLLLETVQDTTNSIAHDMRTPLSRLRLSLRALSVHPQLHAPLREDVMGTIEQLDSIVSMFDNILRIAKAESNTARALFAEFDIVELIDDVLDLYEPLLEEKHLTLRRKLPATPILFMGDKHLVGQCLVNLLENSIKFATGADCIEVILEKVNQNGIDEIRVSVADNGPGIAQDVREKAKQRFFRADKSRNTEGSGLGLSLVNAVVTLHHGELLLEDNSPGLKATLIFRTAIR